MDIPDPYFWDVELFEALFLKIELACKVIVETYNVPDIWALFDDTSMTNGMNLEKRA